MTLVQKLQDAITNQDRSKLAELEIQVQNEVALLKASGQKNYAALVEGLLAEVRNIPVLKVLPEVFNTKFFPTGHPPIKGGIKVGSSSWDNDVL